VVDLATVTYAGSFYCLSCHGFLAFYFLNCAMSEMGLWKVDPCLSITGAGSFKKDSILKGSRALLGSWSDEKQSGLYCVGPYI
jgi:hypothetical protein